MASLLGVGDLPEAVLQRARISEKLHEHQLRDLRELLGVVLTDTKKVAILIDNLDGPWRPGENVEHVSELLWGLLEVIDDIAQAFQRRDHWRKPAVVNVAVFLRSDIFAFIQPLAAEQDKLPIQRIVWDEPELLRRMLDQRLEYGVLNRFDAQAIWKQLFPREVVGVPMWEFVIRTTLPRPRDVIYMVREAIYGAVNRGHQTVTEQDLLDAREKYSEYIFRSILAEDDPRKEKLESILYEFAGCLKVISRSEIHERMMRAEVAPSDIEFYVDLLCDVGFLGIETADGFRYPRHEGERQLMRRVARSLAARGDRGEESFEINAAFYQVLQIE